MRFEHKLSHHLLVFILMISVMLTITLTVLLYIINHHYLLQWDQTIQTESSAALDNPYMGWYHIHGYYLSESKDYSAEDIAADNSETDTRLALVEINLKDYRSQALSDHALASISNILSGYSQTNKQVILRFMYDWQGKATSSEPDSIEQILEHMDQVCSIVNTYADTVYIMQGIFVGNTGEMNNSNYMDTDSMCTLMERLYQDLDSSIYLSVRTPQQYRILNETVHALTEETAYTDTLAARIGLFNDGLLGSNTDLGTYNTMAISMPIADTDYDKKWDRAQELTYQNELCDYVPNGGEVVLDTSLSDFENALIDLQTMHISYLDIDYDTTVLDKWASSTYNGADHFQGCSGYDYITAHMGYRYVIDGSKLTEPTLFGTTTDLAIYITNTGFSSNYMPTDCTLTLVNTDTREELPISIETDSRYWTSGDTITLHVELPLSQLENGSYNLLLTLKDQATGEILSFANEDASAHSSYSIGTLSVSSGLALDQ